MVRIDVTRTDFYNELQPEQQKEYFFQKEKKFLPAIDNIYYSIFLENDTNENPNLKRLLVRLENLKKDVSTSHTEQEFGYGLMLDAKSYKVYKYCLTQPDLYDIFILSYLPNEQTPRILIQIRAYGLWLHGAEKMLSESYNSVKSVFEPLNCKIDTCRESRVDYCYHTNIMVNPEKVLSDKNLHNQVSTTMTKWGGVGNIDHEDGKCVFKKDYFSLGQRRSNNVFIRIYNKALEVIDNGYKGFFFEIWYQRGLISKYDKYCFEYALTQKNYRHVHKGKLYFYLEYGTDERVKKEFELNLNDPNATLQDFKELAKKYMPEVTTIMNIEFETKRKFYYYSDEFIDFALKFIPREGIPQELDRLFKIIDNRAVFLDYLTSTTLCFRQSEDKYASWWNRLRNTKLEGLKIDEKLVRDYSSQLDERIAKVRFINSVATTAVYNNNIDTDFISDISDALSNINDNHVNKFKVTVHSDDGKLVDNFDSVLLSPYMTSKIKKEKRLKNRKKIDKQKETAQNL